MQIAITGIGLITSLGVGQEANRERLLAGTSCVHPAEILPTQGRWPLGEIGLTNEQLAVLAQQDPHCGFSRNVLLGMIALHEASDDAQLTRELLHEMPLVCGTTVGGMDLTERFFGEWQAGNDTHLSAILQHEAGMTTTMLQHFAGMREGTTISTACSSALNALIHGAMLLRIGAAKRVIVGGTEALTRFHLAGFASLGILSKEVCRPFASDRDGINLGEGAAFLVLETSEEAERRGAKVYGYVGGYANRCDAFHPTASSPDGDGAFDAMQGALLMAGVLPAEGDSSQGASHEGDSSHEGGWLSARVPYLNAHGTATPNNDASEMAAIQRLFGEHLPRVESTKALTGHTTSASGAIEAIFTLMRMQECGYPAALTNAFGFGGNDSSLLLSATPVQLEGRPQGSRIGMTELFEAAADADYKPYIPAMQARRLTPVMRRLVVAAHRALERAGLAVPDAIIVATRWGGMIPSAQLLQHLTAEGEEGMSPALFMQSTHNNAAGTLARLLQCKGFNSTYSCGASSLAEAEAAAALLLLTGEVRHVLVCGFDEVAPSWQDCLTRAGIPAADVAVAKIIACTK